MITNTVKERTLKNQLKSQVFCNITEIFFSQSHRLSLSDFD